MTMANSNNVGIKASWSLMAFAKKFSKMKVTKPFTNPNTGEIFRSCAFVDNTGAVTLVGFSSNLGELTPKQIASQKDNLQIVQLESGNYKLCKAGTDNWEEVDLGL